MDDQNKERSPLKGIFRTDSSTVGSNENGHSKTRASNAEQYYAIGSEDEVIKRFKLIQRSGRKVSVPYSLLPVFILPDSSELFIKAYGMLINVQGRNLDPIEKYLSDEILLWLRESPSGKDDGKASTFIKDILIEGKTVSPIVDD